MKSIFDYTREDLFESADKTYKNLFGKKITFSSRLKSQLQKLGLDFRHLKDEFKVYSDGRLEYTNSTLFGSTIISKIPKSYLNRMLDNVDKINFNIYSISNDHPKDFSDSPKYFFKAIYNALTSKKYESDNLNPSIIYITELDYTSGDYSKDK